jgi:hypothetical protein
MSIRRVHSLLVTAIGAIIGLSGLIGCAANSIEIAHPAAAADYRDTAPADGDAQSDL